MAGGKGFTYQLFDSSGSWVCPAGVTQVILIGMGGGAGGCSGPKNDFSYGIGGASSLPNMVVSEVTPGGTYTVTIGSGGAGGSARTTTGTPNIGSAGTNSSFGSVIFKGAPNQGTYVAGNYQYGIGDSQPMGLPSLFEFLGIGLSGLATLPLSNGPFAQSGATGSNDTVFGGSGGASGYGSLSGTSTATGGAGGNASASGGGGSGGTPLSNYGAGGGAGGATITGTSSGAGGSGAGGAIFVVWVEA